MRRQHFQDELIGGLAPHGERDQRAIWITLIAIRPSEPGQIGVGKSRELRVLLPAKLALKPGQVTPELKRSEAAALIETSTSLLAIGDTAGALAAAGRARQILADLLASNPENTAFQRELEVSYEKVGDVQLAQGDLAGALKSYRDSLAIRERLAQSDPGNAGWQRDLSVSYNKVGDVQVAQGKLDEALQSYRQSLAVRERLAAADPNNTQWHNDLDHVIGRIGELAYRLVLGSEFAIALEAADQAISPAPDKIWLLHEPRARAHVPRPAR